MNCINCKLEISPGFVASIRDNRCPACGKECMSASDHGAIFAVVALISSAVSDMQEDATIKLATSLHGKFDIFPKGVVVDNQLTKEVVYVTAGPTHTPNTRRPAPLPVRKANPLSPDAAELPGEQLTPAQLAKLKQFQQLHEQPEEDDTVSFDGPMSEDLRDAEALRLAKQKIAKMRAEHAGVKG